MLTVNALTRLHISASFTLQDGECVALQGPSGVGKSLLLRAIADLDPNEGMVELDGMLRENVPAPLWRKQVTYVASEPGWWADTVQGHFAAWDPAVALVERLGLPPSCGTWGIQRLSTGEKQRLGLVRALMLRSRVLLLDEPTSALDTRSTATVESIIAERVSTGTSAIWSTHDSTQARRVGSRLDVLTNGLIRERAAVEARLALGGTHYQAQLPVIRDALRSGFIPTINSMAATGLVSLPGMMTGQILAGVEPIDAVKYQIMIMFLIAGGTGLGTLSAVIGGGRLLTDHRHRLRLDRITTERSR